MSIWAQLQTTIKCLRADDADPFHILRLEELSIEVRRLENAMDSIVQDSASMEYAIASAQNVVAIQTSRLWRHA